MIFMAYIDVLGSGMAGASSVVLIILGSIFLTKFWRRFMREEDKRDFSGRF
jgi:hypothetical protein